jgi:energy-coupling factor transporter ATP-binding protein EcfA2
MSIFKDLGIYGVSDINETCLLTGLLLGEPVMIIGRPGTGKTELIRVIGAALREHSKTLTKNPDEWFSYQVYDASKLNFEDLVGFPDPNALRESRMDFIKSPQTIWNKDMVCFDEANRCVKERQSNLFEIIRNRCCNGIDTGIKFVFGTMNPYGDVGTQEMSSALVDRHNLFLYFDDFLQMKDEEKFDIIQRVGESELKGTRFWLQKSFEYDVSTDGINHKLAEIGSKLSLLMKKAASIQEKLDNDISSSLSKFITFCLTNISNTAKNSDKNFDISGRRAGMIYRNIIASRALQLAMSHIDSEYEPLKLKELIINVIHRSIPVNVAKNKGTDFVSALFEEITTTVDSYWNVLEHEGADIDTIYYLFNSKNSLKKLDILLSNNIKHLTKKVAWNDLYNSSSDIKSIIKGIYEYFPESIPSHLHSEIKSSDFFLESKIEIPSDLNDLVGEQIDSLFSECKDYPLIKLVFSQGLSYIINRLDNKSKIDQLLAFTELKSFIDTLKKKIQTKKKEKEESLNNDIHTFV